MRPASPEVGWRERGEQWLSRCDGTERSDAGFRHGDDRRGSKASTLLTSPHELHRNAPRSRVPASQRNCAQIATPCLTLSNRRGKAWMMASLMIANPAHIAFTRSIPSLGKNDRQLGTLPSLPSSVRVADYPTVVRKRDRMRGLDQCGTSVILCAKSSVRTTM
jgi:hypothetical protein